MGGSGNMCSVLVGGVRSHMWVGMGGRRREMKAMQACARPLPTRRGRGRGTTSFYQQAASVEQRPDPQALVTLEGSISQAPKLSSSSSQASRPPDIIKPGQAKLLSCSAAVAASSQGGVALRHAGLQLSGFSSSLGGVALQGLAVQSQAHDGQTVVHIHRLPGHCGAGKGKGRRTRWEEEAWARERCGAGSPWPLA
jgi:hypothetical protein